MSTSTIKQEQAKEDNVLDNKRTLENHRVIVRDETANFIATGAGAGHLSASRSAQRTLSPQRSPQRTLSPTRGMSPNRSVNRSVNRSARGMSPSRGMSPNRSLNRSVGASANKSQLVKVRAVPENPTPEVKLRFVFKEFDIRDANKVNLDGFRRVLKALNIVFTEATVMDLFERADKDKAGDINYSEFLNFAQHYPLLIESIYSRCKELFDHEARENQKGAARAHQESLQRKERDMQHQWDEAKERLAAMQAQFLALEESSKNATDDAGDCMKALGRLQQDLEMSKAEMMVKGRDLEEAKEAKHKAQKPLRDMERNVELSQERLTNTEINLDGCHERERELDAMLEEAKRETQQHVELVTEINDQLTEMREHVAELSAAMEDSEKEVNERSTDYRGAEEMVRNLKQEMEGAEMSKNDASLAAKQLAAQLEDERRGLIPFRQREKQQADIHAEALKEFEAADMAFNALELQQAAYDQSRMEAEEAEMALLENEVRLREQRQNVNTRDDVLFAEGGRFLREAGRDDTRLGTTNGRVRGI